MSFDPKKRSADAAFTLIEMITVVAILAILIALATPTLVDVLRSSRMSSAGDGLLNRISLAQQNAIALGKEVELRLFKYELPDGSLPKASFNAYQVVEELSNGTSRPLSDPYYLESGIVFADLESLSPLLQFSQEVPPNTFNAAREATMASLRFYPDGSCKVKTQTTPSGGGTAPASDADYVVKPLTESFFTLVETRDIDSAAPVNYYCVQIDFYTGKTRSYRPE